MKKKCALLLTISIVLGYCMSYSQELISIYPNEIIQGEKYLKVEIVGSQTQFQSSGTINDVWLNKGSNEILVSEMYPVNDHVIHAEILVPCSSDTGLWDVNYKSKYKFKTIKLKKGLRVKASGIDVVVPNKSCLNNIVDLTIRSNCKVFGKAGATVTAGWLNHGDTQLNFTDINVDYKEITATLDVPHNAVEGIYDVNIVEGADTLRLNNYFIINEIVIKSIFPNEACIGDNMLVNINGSCSSFNYDQSSSPINKAWISNNSNNIELSNVVVSTEDLVTAALSIPDDAQPGVYDLYYMQGTKTTVLPGAFRIKSWKYDNDFEDELETKVYPNPLNVNEELVVELSGAILPITQVNLYNITGELVAKKTGVNSFKTVLSIPELTKGIYFIQVITNQSGVTSKIYVK